MTKKDGIKLLTINQRERRLIAKAIFNDLSKQSFMIGLLDDLREFMKRKKWLE